MLTGLRSALRRLWQQFSSRLPITYSVTAPDGTRFFGRSAHRIHFPAVRSGTTEPLTLADLESIIRPGDIVVEIGMYIGVHLVVEARAVGPDGHVYAFEPDRAAVAVATKTLHANGLAERVTIFPAAAGSGPGRAKLHRNVRDLSMNTLIGATRGRTVDVISPDDVVSHADVVKIDAEGSELDVMRGMTRLLSHARHLVVECAPRLLAAAGASPQALLERVRSFGFDEIVMNDDRSGERKAPSVQIESIAVNLVCSRSSEPGVPELTTRP